MIQSKKEYKEYYKEELRATGLSEKLNFQRIKDKRYKSYTFSLL